MTCASYALHNHRGRHPYQSSLVCIFILLIFRLVCVLVTKSCPTLCDPVKYSLPGSSPPGEWDSPGKNTGVGCHAPSWPSNGTQVSCIAGKFFTVWTTREEGSKVSWGKGPDLTHAFDLGQCCQINFSLAWILSKEQNIIYFKIFFTLILRIV